MLSIDERIQSYVPFFDKWYLDNPPQILGRGNSGTVYLVHADDVSAAMKVISIPRDDNQYNRLLNQFGSVEAVNAWIDEEYRYALTEIQIMERLKSDSHIVCFEDAAIIQRTDTYGFDVIIRMERLVELQVFLDTCWDRYRFKRDANLYLRIWSELVSGLSFCERCGITHYDIKPDNIFYAEPSRDYFKLGDFGVSIRSDKGGRTSEGMIVGTPDYMAPEMAAGEGGDTRSDMYSLALVIYELLNKGRLPFVESS